MLPQGLHWIGENVSERLDIVPAQLRAIVVRRPKYACRACEDVIVQAPAPARLIEGGLGIEGAAVQVLVSNSLTTCHSIVRRRSMAGKTSISIAPRWPTGSAVPPGIYVRCTSGWLDSRVEPLGSITEILTRGHPNSQIDDLLSVGLNPRV